MISAWWLLVLCPVCATLGFFTAAILAAERDQLRGREYWEEVAEDA